MCGSGTHFGDTRCKLLCKKIPKCELRLTQISAHSFRQWWRDDVTVSFDICYYTVCYTVCKLNGDCQLVYWRNFKTQITSGVRRATFGMSPHSTSWLCSPNRFTAGRNSRLLLKREYNQKWGVTFWTWLMNSLISKLWHGHWLTIGANLKCPFKYCSFWNSWIGIISYAARDKVFKLNYLSLWEHIVCKKVQFKNRSVS